MNILNVISVNLGTTERETIIQTVSEEEDTMTSLQRFAERLSRESSNVICVIKQEGDIIKENSAFRHGIMVSYSTSQCISDIRGMTFGRIQ